MTSDNSKSQIPRLFRSQKYENLNLSFKTFEIQFKIWDLRLYYSTVHHIERVVDPLPLMTCGLKLSLEAWILKF